MVTEFDAVNEVIVEEEDEKVITSDATASEQSLVKDFPYVFYWNKRKEFGVRKCPYRARTKLLAVKHPEIVMVTEILRQKMRADDDNMDVRINIIAGGGAILTLTWAQSDFIFRHIDLIADLIDRGWQIFAR